MFQEIIIFDTEKELRKLTGLSHEELWDNGFNIDDWDFGVCSKKKLTKQWLLRQMELYCVGYSKVKYQDNYYYLVHHA